MESRDAVAMIDQLGKALALFPDPRTYPDGDLGQRLTDIRCDMNGVIQRLA